MPDVIVSLLEGETVYVAVDSIDAAPASYEISVTDVTANDLPLPAGAVGMLDFKNGVYKWGTDLYAPGDVVDHPEFIVPGLGAYIASYDLVTFDTLPALGLLAGDFLDHLTSGDWTMMIEFLTDGYTAPFAAGNISDDYRFYSEYGFRQWCYAFDDDGAPWREVHQDDFNSGGPGVIRTPDYQTVVFARTDTRLAFQQAEGYFAGTPVEHITSFEATTVTFFYFGGYQGGAYDSALLARIVFFPATATASLGALLIDPVLEPPQNDDFADALPIEVGDTLSGHNYLCTRETDEPDHGAVTAIPSASTTTKASGNSVWYYFIAPTTGNYTVTVGNGSADFNGNGPAVGVYTGSTVNALTEIAGDQDWPICVVTFAAVSGTTYHIAVDGGDGGYNNSTGIALEPAHSPFTILIEGDPGAPSQSGAGSASGVGTATGVGAATKAAAGSSTGTGAADATYGGTVVSGDGAASGTGTASGVGESVSIGAGSASGNGAGSAVGAATVAAAGATAGTGAGAGVGTSPPLDGLSPTAAWSVSRDLLTSFIGGSRYTDTGGEITSLNDQTGNARHMTDGATSTRRPAVSTAGPLSVACANFDGSTDYLTGEDHRNFVSNTSKFIIISGIFDSITRSTNVDFGTSGHAIISDSGGLVGLYGSNDGGADKVYAANYTSGSSAPHVGIAVTEGTAYVITLRQESNVLFVSINGGTESSIACGSTFDNNNAFHIGARPSDGFFDGKFFEAATFSTIPNSGERAALIANFMAHIGAA